MNVHEDTRLKVASVIIPPIRGMQGLYSHVGIRLPDMRMNTVHHTSQQLL
jgi:hypothetical protein